MSLSYDLDGVQMSQQQFLEAFPGGALHIALANTYMLGMRAEACQIFIQRPDLHQLILYNCTAPYDYETDDDQLLERGTFIEQFAEQ